MKGKGNPTKGASQFSGSRTGHAYGKAGANIPKKSKGNPSTGVAQFSGSTTSVK